MTPEPIGDAAAKSAVKGRRSVDYALEGRHKATIYDGTKLKHGMRFNGPAIIEDPGTTIVTHPSNSVEIDSYRNVHITLNYSGI